MKFGLATLVVVLLANSAGAQSLLEREWADSTGKFKVDASLESWDGANATLRLADGRKIEVPKEKLGENELGILGAVQVIEASSKQFELLKPHIERMLTSPAAVLEIFQQIHEDLPDGIASGLFVSCIAAAEGGRQGLATGEKILDQTIRRAQNLHKQFPVAHNLTLMSAFNNRAVMHLRERKADAAVKDLMNAASFSDHIPFVVYHNATLLLEESAPPTTLKLGKKSRSDLVKLLAGGMPEGPGSVVPRRYMYSIAHDEFEPIFKGADGSPSASLPNATEPATEALPIEPGYVQFGSGSGFLISPTLLVTNRHVVEGFDQGLRFRVRNEKDSPGGILARVKKVSDVEDWDLAVLELADPVPDRALPIRIDDVRSGENLTVIGYPMPDVFEQSVAVSAGVVSKLLNGGRHILHDAATNGGNSGGPCVDDKGNVIGVHFRKSSIGIEGGNARNMAINGSALLEFLKATDGYSQLPPRSDARSRPDMLEEATRGVFLVEIWGSGATVRKLNAMTVLPGDAPEVAIKKYGLWPELTCFGCQGTGFRDCQACFKGVIEVLKPVQVGVNIRTGAPITVLKPFPEKCNACNGNGGFRCTACSNGRLNF